MVNINTMMQKENSKRQKIYETKRGREGWGGARAGKMNKKMGDSLDNRTKREDSQMIIFREVTKKRQIKVLS